MAGKTYNLDKPELIKTFADSNIQAAVTKALSGLEAGKTGAVIAIADNEGASLVTMARLNDKWSVVMVGNRKWNGTLSGEAAVTFSW